MGVHADKDTYTKVKELLGIPADEPIFILRAQDRFGEGIVAHYGANYEKTLRKENGTLTAEQRNFRDQVDEVADEFWEWAELEGNATKVPD